MKIENPAALRFIIDDDLYLLESDKLAPQSAVNQSIYVEPVVVSSPQIPAVESETQTPVIESVLQEPEVAYSPQIAVVPTIPQTPVIEPLAQAPNVQPELETPAIDFKYKGVNKKHFLVLVNYPAIDFIADAHLTALESILKRKELALDDISIVNLAHYPNQHKKDLIAFFKPERLLIMGKDALPADLPAPAFNQESQTDGIKTLYSFSFGEMMDSNDNKKNFWDQMKNL